MIDKKKENDTRHNIIELGYRPTDKLDTSRPPKGASGVHVKRSIKKKSDKK